MDNSLVYIWLQVFLFRQWIQQMGLMVISKMSVLTSLVIISETTYLNPDTAKKFHSVLVVQILE